MSGPIDRPLAGHRIVVTRAAHQADGLGEEIRRRGGEAPLLPLLEVTPPGDPAPFEKALREIDRFDVLAFTSANAVPPVSGHLCRRRPDALVVAVGEATEEALREAGVDVVLRPPGDLSRAEGVLDLLRSRCAPGAGIFLPQAGDARPLLAEGLEAEGLRVVAVTAYEKRLPPGAPAIYRELFGGRAFGWVTFTSPRIARHFRRLAGSAWETRRGTLLAASIGTVTSAALRALGVEPAAEASVPGEIELVDAVVETVRSRPEPG